LIQTKATTTDVAIGESINVLLGMKNAKVSSSDLSEVKRSVANSFIFNFESTQGIINRKATLRLMGLPEDFDSTYVEKIEATTVEDVQKVALNRWDISKFVVVVVGNEDAYDHLQKFLKSNPGPLEGLEIKRMKFDQKLLGMK